MAGYVITLSVCLFRALPYTRALRGKTPGQSRARVLCLIMHLGHWSVTFQNSRRIRNRKMWVPKITLERSETEIAPLDSSHRKISKVLRWFFCDFHFSKCFMQFPTQKNFDKKKSEIFSSPEVKIFYKEKIFFFMIFIFLYVSCNFPPKKILSKKNR